MKRLLLLILVVFLLAGCGKQEPAVETTEATVEATEPVSIYMPNSSVEQQTGGAVKVYVPEKDNYIGMGVMGEDIVLVSDLSKLTKVYGEDGVLGNSIKVGETISCESTDFTTSSHGVSYYRDDGLELVFLDADLQQQSKVDIPEGISGHPCVSHTNQEVYYCLGKEVRALHLQTGISRMVKEQACQSIELIASHLDGTMLECKVIEEDGSVWTLYLDSATGQTLDDANQLLTIKTGTTQYLVSRYEGMVYQQIVGTVGGTPKSFNLTEEVEEAFALNGVYRWYMEDGALVLNFYDLESGKHIAQTRMVGVTEPISIAASSKYIWILATEGKQQMLYRWDVTKSPTGNDYSYLSPLYTRENPDTKGLEQCAQRAAELKDKYGIHISVGADAMAVTGDYELVEEFQVQALIDMLKAVETGLAMFPDGFLQESLAKGELYISLVRGIGGGKEVVQFYEGGNAYVVIAASDKTLENFLHGVAYIIDSHVLGNSRDYDDWQDLNPRKFDYDYNYYEYESHSESEYLTYEGRYFVDTYAMTYPHEDRCRTFVYAMLEDREAYFHPSQMQDKLRQLCKGIREAYNIEKNGVEYRWEQHLYEPLAY